MSVAQGELKSLPGHPLPVASPNKIGHPARPNGHCSALVSISGIPLAASHLSTAESGPSRQRPVVGSVPIQAAKLCVRSLLPFASATQLPLGPPNAAGHARWARPGSPWQDSQSWLFRGSFVAGSGRARAWHVTPSCAACAAMACHGCQGGLALASSGFDGPLVDGPAHPGEASRSMVQGAERVLRSRVLATAMAPARWTNKLLTLAPPRLSHLDASGVFVVTEHLQFPTRAGCLVHAV